MPYRIHSKIKGSAVSIVVESAKEALAKLAELTECGHTEVAAKDLSGIVIELSTLQAEADQAR